MNGKQMSPATTQSYLSPFTGEYLKYISVYFIELDADILFERRNRNIDYAIDIIKAVM